MDYLWIIVFPLEMIKFFYIGKIFFDIKIKRYLMIVVAMATYTGIFFLQLFYTDDLYPILIVFILTIASFLMIEDKISKRITVMMKIIFIGSCMDGISRRILMIILGSILEYRVIYFILNNVISISVLLIIDLVKKKCNIKYSGIWKAITYCCAGIMGILIIIAIMETEANANDVGNVRYIMSNVMIIIYYMSIMSIVLFILYVNDMNRRMRKHLETEQLLKETQKNYYETLLEKEESTRNFRHDMINHMILLNSLIVEGQQEEALNYIDNLQEGMKKIQQKGYDVGNEVINAMLNYYIQSLDESVFVSISGKIIKNIAMSQVELCTVFSNLIKNAVEALKNQEQEKKYLKILFNTGNENLKIEMINSAVQSAKADHQKDNKNELPETTKKDKKNHGIGLRNVKETVEKNHGIFYWEQDKTCFKVQVVLPCKK